MDSELQAEEAIFIQWDDEGYGTERPEYGDFHSILLDIHEREADLWPNDEVLRLLKDPTNIWMRNAIPQMKKLLAMSNFPWRYIKSAANVGGKGFDTEEEIRAWLESMIQLIEENLPEKGQNPKTLPKE